MTTEHALVAQGLRKRYGDLHALDGFDLTVAAGTIHGLLGPNGAGKSTAVRALATLIDLDGGTARVAGLDVRRQPKQVRTRIGLVGQHPAVDEILGGRQNLVMFRRLYGLSTAAAKTRAGELLDAFGLAAAAERAVSTYSGGMRRRLDIAAGLILRPAVLFLDEPTTGLDPRARNEVWETVREVAGLGTTVLLTTQFLDEADQLADGISVLDHGRVVASGSPDELKRRLGGDRVTVTFPRHEPLRTLIDGPVSMDEEAHTATYASGSGVVLLAELVRALDRAGITPDDLVLRRPTLDEVFLSLTTEEANR
ncbi:daunorubicin resistance protein DrrA family ABC transporter ATP-binding protein [Actinoplanes friuliensis]|uniref:Daunorubicin resistance ABC transporter ATPase subunit n=1 Tax=Actinoplanes friuliensis DSM 7358 TaxID=1246995 RepID=U5VYC7_9ACTN|nr:daunorubicin resistance protein DrrA family ABC transporter ATP-binding protein [Actinoplanes friuliensis]AGZ41894.1 daunorubicin resistance ABC transporter ATPase subunit [Actinoplanes friuliensis DSM 7358]